MKIIKTPRLSAPVTRRAFTVSEIADQLGIGIDSVYRAVHRGQLKRIAGIGRFMISEQELDRFLAATK